MILTIGQIVPLCDLGVLNGDEPNGDYGDLTVRNVYTADGVEYATVIDSAYGREWDGPSLAVIAARDAL